MEGESGFGADFWLLLREEGLLSTGSQSVLVPTLFPVLLELTFTPMTWHWCKYQKQGFSSFFCVCVCLSVHFVCLWLHFIHVCAHAWAILGINMYQFFIVSTCVCVCIHVTQLTVRGQPVEIGSPCHPPCGSWRCNTSQVW